MISTHIKANGNIILRSTGIGGSILNARQHVDGRYEIFWWFGVGDCEEYVEKFLDLISLAKSEEDRHKRHRERPRPYRDYGP